MVLTQLSSRSWQSCCCLLMLSPAIGEFAYRWLWSLWVDPHPCITCWRRLSLAAQLWADTRAHVCLLGPGWWPRLQTGLASSCSCRNRQRPWVPSLALRHSRRVSSSFQKVPEHGLGSGLPWLCKPGPLFLRNGSLCCPPCPQAAC